MAGMFKTARKFFPVADLIFVPFILPAAFMLRFVRDMGVRDFPLCRWVLMKVGVFPITHHYYEPLFVFDDGSLTHPLAQDRRIGGIDWNVEGQLRVLDAFQPPQALRSVPDAKPDNLTFHWNNYRFEAGDAEYWYNLIRWAKPRRIFEVGSGQSTLMAILALQHTAAENSGYTCRHVCIEPYEVPWLDQAGVEVVRKKIEQVGLDFFRELGENDILFIDSSHIIRPQGDVLFEYLELLPSLNKGVIVHVHDIFTPRDYPDGMLKVDVRFWNEQYLLEALLSSNPDWQIIGAVNFLQHHYHERLKAKCVRLTAESEPGSFYMRKLSGPSPAVLPR